MGDGFTGSFPIDFVIPWVDGADPAWQEEKRKYSGEDTASSDSRDSRYRDWDLLKYWFRGVEQCAPWVNRIYFITNGQLPDWLNLEAEKLVHVKHADYMPEEYLPTFSANPIELNFHRISDLSEHFVYFNDDFFLLRPVEPEYFFRDGLPVFVSELRPIIARRGSKGMANIYVNDMSVINERFTAKEIVKNRKNWFSPVTHSWKCILLSLYFSRNEYCIGFRNHHVAVPTLKSTMERIWKEEPELLDATSRRRLRDSRDVNQYVFRYWQYATNQFAAEKADNIGRYFEIQADTSEICSAIRERKFPQVCLNDMNLISTEQELERAQGEITEAFESIFPEKSRFES